MAKKNWGMRPVINLKNLNAFMAREHIKMKGLHLLSSLVQPGDCMVHKGECEGCLFSHPDTLKISEIPQVGGKNVSIHLHPVRFVISTKNFNQAGM